MQVLSRLGFLAALASHERFLCLAFESMSSFSSSSQPVPAAAPPAHPSLMGGVSLLGQTAAQKLDEDLMSTPGFSVDQLMELAGLSVACAVATAYPLRGTTHKWIYVLAGPGNNGGDGLVAARHLAHFGYRPVVVYPKPTEKPLYVNLLKQCRDMGISVFDAYPGPEESSGIPQPDVILDSLFGFSFKGKPRPPFDLLIQEMNQSGAPVVSVDIPSGWDVEGGPSRDSAGIHPAVLVSLTAPKLCSRFFTGRHFLGGRFVPPAISKKYGLQLPPYSGVDQIVELKAWGREAGESPARGKLHQNEKGEPAMGEAEVSWGPGMDGI